MTTSTNALRIGGDIRTEKSLDDRNSVFGQLILSHQFGRKFEIFVIPTYVTDAGRDPSTKYPSAKAIAAAILEITASFIFLLRAGSGAD